MALDGPVHTAEAEREWTDKLRETSRRDKGALNHAAVGPARGPCGPHPLGPDYNTLYFNHFSDPSGCVCARLGKSLSAHMLRGERTDDDYPTLSYRGHQLATL